MTAAIDPLDHIIIRENFITSGGSHRQIVANLRRGVWLTLARGAYFPAVIWSNLSNEQRYCARVQARLLKSYDGAACLESAAVLHGLPLVEPLPTVVHTVNFDLRHGGRITQDRHRHSWQDAPSITTIGGLPATTLTRTLVDLARWRHLPQAIVPVEHALRTRGIDSKYLMEHPAISGRSPGADRARRLFALASNRSESPGESLSRAVFHIHGLEMPVSQLEVVGADGRKYRADFGWPHLKLLGEFDGRSKYGEQPNMIANVLWEEKKREDALREAGYRVVRWVWSDLHQPERLIRRLTSLGLTSERTRKQDARHSRGAFASLRA